MVKKIITHCKYLQGCLSHFFGGAMSAASHFPSSSFLCSRFIFRHTKSQLYPLSFLAGIESPTTKTLSPTVLSITTSDRNPNPSDLKSNAPVCNELSDGCVSSLADARWTSAPFSHSSIQNLTFAAVISNPKNLRLFSRFLAEFSKFLTLMDTKLLMQRCGKEISL